MLSAFVFMPIQVGCYRYFVRARDEEGKVDDVIFVFKDNYMNVVKSRITHDKLKEIFEKLDNDGLGTLTKVDYVKAVATTLPEFDDEDHMRFLRITNMFNKLGEVKYPELLNLIFFYNNDKLNDKFMKLCHILWIIIR